MKNVIDNDVQPSPTPRDEDIRAWHILPREEQLRRLRAALSHPDCSNEVADTVQDVLAIARQQNSSERGKI